jgi:uncharacterized membrane protein
VFALPLLVIIAIVVVVFLSRRESGPSRGRWSASAKAEGGIEASAATAPGISQVAVEPGEEKGPEALSAGAVSPQWLRRRVDDWVKAGIIDRGQGKALVAHESAYGTVVEKAAHVSGVVTVVSIVGSVLLAVGVILLLGRRWHEIHWVARVILPVVAVIALGAVGWYLRYGRRFPRTGEAFIFSAAVATGGAVFLVADAISASLENPLLLVFWFLPLIPLGYLAESQLVLALGVGVGYAALGWSGANWLEGTGLTATVAIGFYAIVGVIVLAVGTLHRVVGASREGAVYWWLGLLTMIGSTYLLGNRHVYEVGYSAPGRLWVAFGIAIGIALVLLAAAAWFDRRTEDRVKIGQLACGGLVVAVAAIPLLFPSLGGWAYFAMANLVLLVVLSAMVVLGIRAREALLLNGALVAFAVVVLTRYMEVGVDSLGRELGFVIGGLLLIGVAAGLERFRRSAVARWTGRTPSRS